MGTFQSVRVGCASGFWGDSADGAAQLVEKGAIDYLVFDYLAEITMSILARAMAKDPSKGYAVDFVTQVMASLGPEIARKGIKVIANAGGLNPKGCKKDLEDVLASAGVELNVAVVMGDNLLHQVESVRQKAISTEPFPDSLSSINAYLGCSGIVKALEGGADVVITGRCVDSALALGPLVHEFGWSMEDYDLLATGSLIGHIIECGTQATGGLFTDWRKVEGWDNMGFPIAECWGDGSFDITKPPGTGGLVTPQTVSEQIVYEIGDPAAYVLPDVVCDFTQVSLTQKSPSCVSVTGAKGAHPTPHYKVCATYQDGYRAVGTIMVGGMEAVSKAQGTAEAIIRRSRRIMTESGYDDFSEVLIELLGAEHIYGPHSNARGAREVIIRIGVRHQERKALMTFAREFFPAGTSMAPGLTGFSGGRPAVVPVIRLHSALIEKGRVTVAVEMDDKMLTVPVAAPAREANAVRVANTDLLPSQEATPPSEKADMVQVPLIALAHGRSGDKGDTANIGIIAREKCLLPAIKDALSVAAVGRYFAHLVKGPIERFELPGLNALNFLLHNALGGGGIASLRNDAQGKTYAQMLLDYPVNVPAMWFDDAGQLSTDRVRKVTDEKRQD